MKNLKAIIKNAICVTAIASMALATTSCDDLLDTKPQGVFTDEQIGDDEAADLMTAAYATLLCHYFGNNESFAGPINNWVFDVRSDDALKGGDGVTMEGYIHQLEVGNVQSDNDVANFKWRNNYYSISRCNTAIRGIVNAEAISPENKAVYIAEMKTLRAYYYFDMLRIFQKFPYFDETVTNPSECRADEYTRDQIVGFIKQDLRDSYEVLLKARKSPEISTSMLQQLFSPVSTFSPPTGRRQRNMPAMLSTAINMSCIPISLICLSLSTIINMSQCLLCSSHQPILPTNLISVTVLTALGQKGIFTGMVMTFTLHPRTS